MNFLFTFQDHIDVSLLLDFEMFCWELNEIVCVTTSANDNDEQAEFPANFIIVYVDTEDKDHLDIISNKYYRLIAESEFCQQGEYSTQQSISQ